MLKKILLTVLVFGIALLAKFLLNPVLEMANSNRFNVVLISIDDLRADHMGVYGYSRNTTPFIDAWSKNATVFTNVQTAIPSTHGSFAALLTGDYPWTTGMTQTTDSVNLPRNKVNSLTETLPEILKAYGFYTAAFVSNYFLSPDFTRFNEGFDEYHAFNKWSMPSKSYLKYFTSTIPDWIRLHKNKKFFLWVHLMDVHTPYDTIRPRDVCLFVNNCTSFVSQVTTGYAANEEASEMGCYNSPLPNNFVQVQENLYDGGIVSADQNVGIIINTLRKYSLNKKTIIILYSDHGEGFDHNFYFTHGSVLYNSNTRIPLIIKVPFLSGGKDNKLIENTDILPTLLNLLNIKGVSKYMEGLSFADDLYFNFLDTIQLDGRKYTYSMIPDSSKFSIYNGRYKLIESFGAPCMLNDRQTELYDLKSDPQELSNIVSSHPLLAERLKSNLKGFFSKYNIPVYLSNDTTSIPLVNPVSRSIASFDAELKRVGY